MTERSQPYLLGFSPSELSLSFVFSSVVDVSCGKMRVEKQYSDYYIYLTEDGIRRACSKNEGSFSPVRYYPLNACVESDESKLEVMQLRLTRDSSILWDGFSHQDIVFERGEKGPLVWVYTPRVAQLLEENPQAQVMTRYDGTNKIWIMRDPLELSRQMLSKIS